MVHADYQDMLATRALDALDDTGARLVDEHLAGCAECVAELEAWRHAASLLAHDANLVESGAEIGKRIMDQVRRNPAARSETGSKVVPMPSRTFGLRRVLPALLKIAAAIAFVALMAGTFFFWKRDLELRREVARLSREIRSQQTEMARERDTIALLTGPDSKLMELAGTEQAKNAHATFAFDRSSGRAVLLTEGLPATAADKAYELWFISNGHPLPGKVFAVDASGRATLSDQVPPEAREHAVFAVTLEPRGGASSPTGPIYLSSPSS